MNDLTPILAIETSGKICGVCLYVNPNEFYSAKIILKHSHSEKLFELIEQVMISSGRKINDISSIAVSSGPGSFTGLRIGLAAAKGISESLSIPIVQVPTFEALATQLIHSLPDGAEFIIANKVGRDELYFAVFQIKSNSYIFKEQLKIIHKLKLADYKDLCNIYGDFDQREIFGVFAKNISAPEPEFVAQWAVQFGQKEIFNQIDYLEPNYLKDFIVKEKKQ